mmetsp:Transcript_29891/g.48844  ORF Transcript_29891/g.48844 Transcript_29891/m.48844 type:complete len:116 (-) Transcript_29891:492-839(-)
MFGAWGTRPLVAPRTCNGVAQPAVNPRRFSRLSCRGGRDQEPPGQLPLRGVVTGLVQRLPKLKVAASFELALPVYLDLKPGVYGSLVVNQVGTTVGWWVTSTTLTARCTSQQLPS